VTVGVSDEDGPLSSSAATRSVDMANIEELAGGKRAAIAFFLLGFSEDGKAHVAVDKECRQAVS
jgi:hypothetical protein